MKQANSAHRRHAVRCANVYPLLAEKFPLRANEKSFLEFTGTSDPKVARQYLDMTEGDLDVAVATYVDREVPFTPPSAVRDADASLVSVLEDLDSGSDEFASSPRANDDLSTDEDDGNQKLPAARPAVLSTAAVSSSTQLPRDDDDDGDNSDDDNDDDDNDDDDNDDDNVDDDDDGIRGMSGLELKRMRNVARNNARLASLGLLMPMTSAATLSSDLSKRT